VSGRTPISEAPVQTAKAAAVPVRTRRGVSGGQVLVAGIVVGGSLIAGHFLALAAAPALHSKMLPWILGRGLGLASFLCLTALTAVGIWLRHPWKGFVRVPSPAATLRAHAALAAATVTLVAGHLTALALDHYAGVGWLGAFVPWKAVYRPTPVALGVLALWAMLIVGFSAALAGRIGSRQWLPIHKLAWLVFVAAWLHGVTAGSDTSSLRVVYGICGGVVLAIAISARFSTPPIRLERGGRAVR